MTTTKSRKLLFLSFAAIVTSIIVAALSVGRADTPPRADDHKSWPETRAGQLIFFAVLEGLYRDGVTNSDVDLIIPPGDQNQPKYDKEIFVYACPLCHPAFEAFRLYRHRDRIYGLKQDLNTFGPGLNQATRAKLQSSNPEERRQGVEGLINRWVNQRLELMRLTTAERESIAKEIEAGRKKGMGMLKQFVKGGELSQSRTNCAICDGSAGACKLPPR